MKTIRVITALDAVVATTTSNKFYVGGATRIGFLFRRELSSEGGTSTFTVNIGGEAESTVTPTMLATNMLIPNVAGDNTKTLAHVANIALTTDVDSYVWLDPVCLCTWVSVTATEATGGSHTAFIMCEYSD